MELIQEWLKGHRPYEAGVQLYMQHGSDGMLRKLFAEDYSEYKNNKLVKVLEDLCDGVQPVKIVAPLNVTEPLTSPEQIKQFTELVGELEDSVDSMQHDVGSLQDDTENLEARIDDIDKKIDDLKKFNKTAPRGWPADMDETMRGLHDQWLPLFSEKKNLQSRIYDVAKAGLVDALKKTEAGAMAHKILDLRDACRMIYLKRDFYLQYAKLPDEIKPLQLVTDIKKYPVALFNHKKYVRNYKGKLLARPGDKKLMAQLAKHEWAVIEYEKLLGLNDVV